MFSPFDTIHLILSLEYPKIPADQRRAVAKALIPVCKETFATYPLGDDYASRHEFRRLKDELRHTIRYWIDENGVPGYRPKLKSCEKTPQKRKI